MDAIALRIYGEPQPQGNKTGFVRGGRVVMVEGRRPESREAFKDWRGGVSAAAKDWQRDHDAPTLAEPVRVEMAFYLTKPASLPKWRWLPRARPDIDKLARAVLDGITGTIVKDDGLVVSLMVTKTYAMGKAPGASITVTPLGAAERAGDEGAVAAVAVGVAS